MRHPVARLRAWPGSVLLVLVCGACTFGSCSAGGAGATPAVGDTCLVRSWTEVMETNSTGYTWLNVPLAVSGLAGARMTISPDGSLTEVFDGSRPLVGVDRAGQQLVIGIRGTVHFHIHGDGKTFTETGTRVEMPTVASLNGQPVTYHSEQSPGPGTYTCSKTALTMTTANGVQADQWAPP